MSQKEWTAEMVYDCLWFGWRLRRSESFSRGVGMRPYYEHFTLWNFDMSYQGLWSVAKLASILPDLIPFGPTQERHHFKDQIVVTSDMIRKKDLEMWEEWAKDNPDEVTS